VCKTSGVPQHTILNSVVGSGTWKVASTLYLIVMLNIFFSFLNTF